MTHSKVTFDPKRALEQQALTQDEKLLADLIADPGQWFEIRDDPRPARKVATALRKLHSYPESGRGGERLEPVSLANGRQFIRYVIGEVDPTAIR